jgi:hypothetical protein
MKAKNLFTIVDKHAGTLDTLYRNNTLGREDLLEFMEGNGWFGMAYFKEKKTPMVEPPIPTSFTDALTLWLSAYKKSGRDKIKLMLGHFGGIYPETCELYHAFVSGHQLWDNHNTWRLLDYLFSEIDKEITAFSETEIESLVQQMESEAPLIMVKMFADFLQTSEYMGEPLTRWIYSFNRRDCPELAREAYPFDDFAVMAYCVFNEDMWNKQSLIAKAVKEKSFADMWLFVAMHFICALRVSDMKRLPAPALPYPNDVVFDKVLNGAFSTSESVAVTEELRIRLKMKRLKPHKTSTYDKVPDIKLFVPESLKNPLGMIIAIALAHHPEIKPGDGFIKYSDRYAVKEFFGPHFADALKGKRFSSRRANKSYLQGIEIIANSHSPPGKPKGYMLAALARSHKSGIGTLPETTDVYLKDAAFTGYTPEFIAHQMFERGVFSFIPAVLLEMYAGDDYTSLPVSFQTKLIHSIGLESHRIEWVSVAVDRALAKSRATVAGVLKEPTHIKENIFAMLQNIASGNAPSKQDDCLCLMTAAELPCSFPGRAGCIGCGYEIYTKAAMHTLVQEYVRLAIIKNKSQQAEARRYGYILEKAIIPAITEMLHAVQLLYPDADTTVLMDIMEGGIALVDSGAGDARQLPARYGCPGSR